MDFPRCYALLLVIHVATLILQVESFTVQSPDNKENRALRQHDYQLSDFKHDTLYPEAKTAQTVNILKENHDNINIKTNKCKNGARSSTNCILTETKNEEINTVVNNKNRDAARLKDNHITSDDIQYSNKKNHNNLPTFPNAELLLSEETVKKKTGTKNCTEMFLENSSTNTTKTIKMIPMLDALRKMLIALNNLLALAINNSVNNYKNNGNKTESNVTNILPAEEAETQPPEVIITPKAYNIKENINSNSDVPLKSDVEDNIEIKENEETISSTSDLIDEAIEDLVKNGIVTTFEEQFKSPRADLDSKKLLSAIEETENTRLYKWCVRRIRGEKSGDKKKLKSLLKSKETKNAFESLHTDKPEFRTKSQHSQTTDEEKLTNFINSVLDCIGFVNTMQNIYHPRK